ncbi:MAG: DUF6475 domain-containing protein [Hydrogenovibrio sp.]|uniref:DUF6475 domain-containing protein n=1 Tax=Hydrogenovibrio sp. TaxID=2065821 RepID=UPI0028701E88|nr:DUF6475 domain-containing protein [Hydrogenovibrio sp.]MDR9499611.1 DUF6475 domain-containing protein [Hydrogenovibrio sp.]
MQQQDLEKFSQILTTVFAYYEKDLTEMTFELYWNGLKHYSIEQVQQAFNAHMQHPEEGRWWPKISDIIKHCKGGSQDRALVAWNLVENAIRRVGAYQDVVFSDPLIHHIIHRMGGWISLCDLPDERSLTFKANEFKNTYRGLYGSPAAQHPPEALTGIVNQQNAKIKGARLQPPVYIGDPDQARQVAAQLQTPQAPIEVAKAGQNWLAKQTPPTEKQS